LGNYGKDKENPLGGSCYKKEGKMKKCGRRERGWTKRKKVQTKTLSSFGKPEGICPLQGQQIGGGGNNSSAAYQSEHCGRLRVEEEYEAIGGKLHVRESRARERQVFVPWPLRWGGE